MLKPFHRGKKDFEGCRPVVKAKAFLGLMLAD